MDDINSNQIDPANELTGKEEEMMLGGVDEAKELKKKLEESEAKNAEYLLGWQRAKADYANYKKDEVARLEEVVKYSSEDLLKEFITVLDSLDLAINSLEKNGQAEKGIYMIRAQLGDALKKRGLTKIDVKPGDIFDPNFNEALVEVESELPVGAIVDEIEPGYRLFEKVIRATRVRISKGKTQ